MRVQLFWELLRANFAPPEIAPPADYRPLAGNYVVIEGGEGYAFYAHLRAGSIGVRAGQRVAAGQIIGALGNSGNSTMPHLHFHLMDGPDPVAAKGLACKFQSYERWTDERWELVNDGIPGALERIRVEALAKSDTVPARPIP
jgi:murein DD-endopeptidase MepM/ murein hydrolase activator NlpD